MQKHLHGKRYLRARRTVLIGRTRKQIRRAKRFFLALDDMAKSFRPFSIFVKDITLMTPTDTEPKRPPDVPTLYDVVRFLENLCSRLEIPCRVILEFDGSLIVFRFLFITGEENENMFQTGFLLEKQMIEFAHDAAADDDLLLGNLINEVQRLYKMHVVKEE